MKLYIVIISKKKSFQTLRSSKILLALELPNITSLPSPTRPQIRQLPSIWFLLKANRISDKLTLQCVTENAKLLTFGTVPVKLALFQPSQKLSYVRLSSYILC